MNTETAAAPAVTTRIRVNHSRTIKEGWGYETTVEVAWAGDGPGVDVDALARLDLMLARARTIGELERDARNAADGGGPV